MDHGQGRLAKDGPGADGGEGPGHYQSGHDLRYHSNHPDRVRHRHHHIVCLVRRSVVNLRGKQVGMAAPPALQPSVNRRPLEPGRGGIVLTLGILSLMTCALLGPFAWVMGKDDLRKMENGLMDDRDRSITQGGMICGIIASALLILTLFLIVVWFVGVLLLGSFTVHLT